MDRQLGLQFFPDRPAALAEMRRVLVTGGRLGLSVYGPIEHNPAAFALARALDSRLGPDASVTKRAEHALADPALLRTLAAGAGFCRVQIMTETRIIRFASAADCVRIQLTATPLASLLRHQADGSVRQLAQTLTADVAAALQARQADGGLAFPSKPTSSWPAHKTSLTPAGERLARDSGLPAGAIWRDVDHSHRVGGAQEPGLMRTELSMDVTSASSRGRPGARRQASI